MASPFGERETVVSGSEVGIVSWTATTGFDRGFSSSKPGITKSCPT